MLYAVAWRFGGFTETEIFEMPLSRLRFWYRGHKLIYEAEKGSDGE